MQQDIPDHEMPGREDEEMPDRGKAPREMPSIDEDPTELPLASGGGGAQLCRGGTAGRLARWGDNAWRSRRRLGHGRFGG